MSDPWMKFYPSDWRSDPRLRMCSLAARGLWVEMLGLMHEAEPIGHLLVGDRSPTDAQLAALVGAPIEQVSELLGELESTGVFSRTRKGVIFSRRMTRDAKKAATARKNGKSGGNPTLGKGGKKSPSDNPPDKGGDKAQKPEARSQSKEGETNVSPKKERGQRLSTDWVLPKAWGDWAVSEGYDPETVRRESEKFRDYWISQPGQRGVKLDWQATWRNWIRNSSAKPQLRAIPGGRNDRSEQRHREDQATDEYIRRRAAGEIDLGPDPSDPFAGK